MRSEIGSLLAFRRAALLIASASVNRGPQVPFPYHSLHLIGKSFIPIQLLSPPFPPPSIVLKNETVLSVRLRRPGPLPNDTSATPTFPHSEPYTRRTSTLINLHHPSDKSAREFAETCILTRFTIRSCTAGRESSIRWGLRFPCKSIQP